MGIVPTANLEYDAMDLLDRQSFVDQLMNVAQTLSENKKVLVMQSMENGE